MKKILSLFGSLFLLVSTQVWAIPDEEEPSVTAYFTPSTVNSGDTTTLVWNSINTIFCEVTGVPGFPPGGKSGSYAFTATESLNATVMCEGYYSHAGALAKLTVNNTIPAPVITASFSPSTIAPGQSSTLSWNANNAHTCSDNKNLGVSGTSGSLTVSPQNSFGVTISCSGAGGVTHKSISLTISSSSPPSMHFFAWQSVIYSPQLVTLELESSSGSNCSIDGTNVSSGFATVKRWVGYTRTFTAQCTNSSGTTTKSTTVYYRGGFPDYITQPGQSH